VKQTAQQESNPSAPVKTNTADKSKITFTQITTGPLLKWVDNKCVEFDSYPRTDDGGVKKNNMART
jgi:hypothetical protein